MGKVIETNENIWVVAHGKKRIHFVELKPGQVLETGQDNCETYDNEQDAVNRCLELNPNWVHPDEEEHED